MAGVTNFNPENDIPSLAGKVIFVTGGTNGLGRESILAFAKHSPAHIYFTGRDSKAAASLAAALAPSGVPSTFLELDMASLPTVKAAVQRFSHGRLDILMCNAGIMAKPPSLTKDGYELQFGVNHMAHGAIIQGLLPVLQKTADEPGSDVRVVCLTSTGWRAHPKAGVDFNQVRTTMDSIMGSWGKLANIVYARELAKRHPNITAVSIHPGVVETTLVTELSYPRKKFVYIANSILGDPIVRPEEGCYNQVWAAAAAKKSELVNGAVYYPVGKMSNGNLDKVAQDPKLAEKLWDWTNEELAKI
ncbi:oxidoreductase, short-chain dehydrogenase/reductase family [Sporothrix brasiliensis 5110]|uniref:Oxidoreductase, short-chain dehydrogenase/reductase family n=1 Tax=Sporothrix brasiliensis 5110 TaxID=1398154 RepID=A0A0C2IFA0_9PEZI|nr:oxidoreductase, short-chain dehydrogenase/reductase family [Sporothrix brasiliensis 5110]KIH87901.1 oxidoreductase, short-chain dehydrogenase/reductase family [Sporothrix brasiliensis 5110]